MTSNGWQQLSNIWFGNRSPHVSHSCYCTDLTLPRDFQGWRPALLKKMTFARCSTEIRDVTPWSIMPVAAFSVNHVCPQFQIPHARVWDRKKFRFTPRVRKNWKRKTNALINHEIAYKQLLYYDLFTEWRENTLECKKKKKNTEKFHFICHL